MLGGMKYFNLVPDPARDVVLPAHHGGVAAVWVGNEEWGAGVRPAIIRAHVDAAERRGYERIYKMLYHRAAMVVLSYSTAGLPVSLPLLEYVRWEGMREADEAGPTMRRLR